MSLTLSNLPDSLIAVLRPALEKTSETSEICLFDYYDPDVSPEEQEKQEDRGSYFDWYDLGNFGSYPMVYLGPVGDIDDYKEADETPEDYLRRYLMDEDLDSDDWVDCFVFDEFPDTIFVCNSYLQGQAGVTAKTLGTFPSIQAVYDFALEGGWFVFHAPSINHNFERVLEIWFPVE